MKLVCRTELWTAKMVEDTSSAQDMVDKAVRVVHENASYDKDVAEIKLPDTVVSSGYGGNFVKDVCIDDGQLMHRKISEEKIVDEKSSPKFDCLMTDTNSDPRYGRKDDARKSAHELKPDIVLPVGFAPDGNNEKRYGGNKEKQYSSCEEYDLEGRSTTTYFAGDLSEKKISLEELLRLESAEESQHNGAISSENSENHMPPLHGEAVEQVSINDCHGVASKTSEPVNISIPSKDSANGCSATTSEERDAASAFDVGGPNQVNHYNPSVGHGSLEDTCKPECSISAITDAASTEPICTAEKTDSFSDVVSGSKGFNEVEMAERSVDAPSSSSSDIQSSEKSNDKNGNLASEAITDAVDETAVASSSSANNVEANGANGENHVDDFNQRDEENCVDTMNDDVVGKSSMHAQKDNVGKQSAPDSAKVTSRIGNGYPPFEPGLFGPSIMSAPVSNSGHIAYSGNISIRSDSSTTSTRSFAFPVLQREWISSPVRMAKGERRRIRRRRGWRKGLLCCKF